MSAIIHEEPKLVELALKMWLPENYVKAVQEILHENVWNDPNLNFALNCVFYTGLNAALMGIALPLGEKGKEENDEFLDKSNIDYRGQFYAVEILQMAWRKEGT